MDRKPLLSKIAQNSTACTWCLLPAPAPRRLIEKYANEQKEEEWVCQKRKTKSA